MKRILCGFLVALVIVCALLIAADLFNITQYIPLTQNYDWLAFIGAIIGGIATFSGVYFTLDYQKKSDEEKKRNDIEIDFIISNNSKTKYKMYPIEVKSGKNYSINSLKKFRDKFKDRIGECYIIHPRNLTTKEDILCIPPYMAICL